MQTTSALIDKQFKELKADNEKLGKLGVQMGHMADDFEDMKRTREEAKKQLEAKFQDVYRKIQNTKDFISAEGKRINDTLLAFQSKFENELRIMNEKLQVQHDNFVKETNTHFVQVEDQLKVLDQKIDKEREDRERQTDENLKVIRQQISSLQEGLNQEKVQRIEEDKSILAKLANESFALTEKLDQEKTERILKTKELRDHTNYEINQLTKLNEEFHRKTIDEFKHVANNLEKEMDNRFQQQDQIVDNLSNIVKTIQDTLKVIGKDI